ncbi:MAG TPA: YggT family protein [Chloroflexota bacterium]|jgi:YggT family protein|nr:YggT family protein [Chloroflexota bacterium]
MTGFAFTFLNLLLQILSIAILVRVLLTWFPIDQSNPIIRLLFDVTEPVLAPFRRIIPRIGMFDLSPIAAMLVIQFVQQHLPDIFRTLAL